MIKYLKNFKLYESDYSFTIAHAGFLKKRKRMKAFLCNNAALEDFKRIEKLGEGTKFCERHIRGGL